MGVKKAMRYFDKKFVDTVSLFVQGGHGGQGAPKIGGVGGSGADVFVKAKEGQTMEALLKSYPEQVVKGGNGENARPTKAFASSAKAVNLYVPCGVSIRNGEGTEIAEMNEPDDTFHLVHGGMGGDPLNGFIGRPGQSINISVLLKLIADVGLVGFPNAGKSTTLTAVSNAKPKIANYPFTTLHPNLGEINYPDTRKITLADLPGLIEGAWQNQGLGHSFLRHVERTKILMFVIDVDGFRLSPEYPKRSAFENFLLLNKELELYKESLLQKPAILVVNKMDTYNASKKFDEFMKLLDNLHGEVDKYPDEMISENYVYLETVLAMSAKKDKESVEALKKVLRELLDKVTEAEMKSAEALNEAELAIRECDPHTPLLH